MSKHYNPKVEKFFNEMRIFFKNHNYSVGEMLYTLDREVTKTGKTYITLTDEEIIECLEKATINERE